MRTIAVVGGSLAGLSAARALRAQGFDGRVVVIGAEEHSPYDRPPLSKEFLAGRVDATALSLAAPGDDGLDLEWRLGVRAEDLQPARSPAGEYLLRLSSGERIAAQGVVVATGGRPRPLPGRGGVAAANVFTLRTLEDALAIRAALQPGARLLVVGGGFIGAEVASTAVSRGLDSVTVVEAADAPMEAVLGPRYAKVCASWHADHGVQLLTGVGVSAFADRSAGGVRSVTHVMLADQRKLEADLVVVGVGTVPNAEWLVGSGLSGPTTGSTSAANGLGNLAGGVLTDAAGGTNLPGVVATGDVAAAPDPFTGAPVRREHWTEALQHPAVAVATLLGRPAPALPVVAALPYFWSDQYEMRLQVAGHVLPGDDTELVEGDPAENAFVVLYRRDQRPVAVLGVNRPRVFNRWRRELAASVLALRAPGNPPPTGIPGDR